jgi:IMP cyclohydrolase
VPVLAGVRLAEALGAIAYPGRGVVVARTAGEGLCYAYLVTGRSEASRDRQLVGVGDQLVVEARTASSVDPLRHYRAARGASRYDVVGNGDHVDQLVDLLDDEVPPFEALRGLRPEPDGLRTARLAALVERRCGAVVLGAARATPAGEDHLVLVADQVPPGWGCLLTTYVGGDASAPAVGGLPAWVEVPADAAQLGEAVWGALDPTVRVAIAVRPLPGDGRWRCRPGPDAR